MKLTELLVSITIFLLVCICSGECYILFSKTSASLKSNIGSTSILLETDAELRSEIKNIDLPYWKNSKNILEHEKELILIKQRKNEITVHSCEILKTKTEMTNVMKITWSFNGKTYETLEELNGGIIVNVE